MAKQRPRVSVIIPTYNRAKFLRDAIPSVLNQRDAGVTFEVLVVDDGSTDDTAKVVSSFKGVRYLRLPHSGKPSVPRNVGVQEARGSLLAFHDSDDVWAEDKLALQVPLFADPKVVLSFGGVRDFQGDGRFRSGAVGSGSVHDLRQADSGDIFEKLIWSNFVVTPTVIVRKSAVRKAGGFDLEYPTGRDYILWVKVSALGNAAYLPETLAYIRKHAGHVSPDTAIDVLHNRIVAYRTLYRHFAGKRRGLVGARLESLYSELAHQAKLERATVAADSARAGQAGSKSRFTQAKLLAGTLRKTRHPRVVGGQLKRVIKPRKK